MMRMPLTNLHDYDGDVLQQVPTCNALARKPDKLTILR